jgi:Sulfotransferase family
MSAGVQLASSVEELAAKARKITAIDILDEDAFEPLTVLHRAMNQESGLHAQGARALETRLLRVLCNRLRMQRDYKLHPEIAGQKIVAPIVVCGAGRTGSTKTQKLLAASGDFNWLPFWQALNPSLLTGSRAESPQPRIDDTERFARWFDAATPEVKYAHAFETHEPEEESPLIEHSLRSPVWFGWSPIASYLGWLATQDMSAQFVYLRDALKYLQWQGLADPARRWVLKSPMYTGMEPALQGVFPDACLLMTHRHPIVTVPSGIRLVQLFYKPYTDSIIDADMFTTGQAMAFAAHMRNRALMPDWHLLDIDFNEMVGVLDPVIDKIYKFCDAPLTAASRDRMLKWNRDNPPHHKGKHVYALSDYHLTEQKIDDLFSAYIQFLKSRFET